MKKIIRLILVILVCMNNNALTQVDYKETSTEQENKSKRDFDVAILTLRGQQTIKYAATINQMRGFLFDEYPYLCNRDAKSEALFTEHYVHCDDNLLIVAKDINSGSVVGLITAMPLNAPSVSLELKDMRKLFIGKKYDLDDIFYLSISFLLPEYRGLGIGSLMYETCEKAIRQRGTFKFITLCGIDRGDDKGNARRPPNYKTPYNLWLKEGYVRRNDMMQSYWWRDLGSRDLTNHYMVFWMKTLNI